MNSKNRNRWLFWIGVALVFFLFLFLIRSILLPFIVGMLIAYFLDPAADRLEKWKFSRTMATSTITGTFFCLLFLVLTLMLPVVAKQLSGLLAALPGYIQSIEQQYGEKLAGLIGELNEEQSKDIKATAGNLSGVALKVGSDFIAGIFSSGMAFVNLLSLLLITPIVTFYLLRDWDNIVKHIDSLLPRKHADTIREQMRIIDDTLAGFLRGQMNVCMLLGIFYAIGLSLLGLKFGMVIGLATGFLVIFPYVGMIVGAGIGLGVAFFQFGGDLTAVAQVAGVFLVGQVIEGNFITPKLVGEKVGLHPVWIIFGMLAGAALFGFVGILLAIPITAIVGVLIRFAISQYKLSDYYHGEQAKNPSQA